MLVIDERDHFQTRLGLPSRREMAAAKQRSTQEPNKKNIIMSGSATWASIENVSGHQEQNHLEKDSASCPNLTSMRILFPCMLPRAGPACFAQNGQCVSQPCGADLWRLVGVVGLLHSTDEGQPE